MPLQGGPDDASFWHWLGGQANILRLHHRVRAGGFGRGDELGDGRVPEVAEGHDRLLGRGLVHGHVQDAGEVPDAHDVRRDDVVEVRDPVREEPGSDPVRRLLEERVQRDLQAHGRLLVHGGGREAAACTWLMHCLTSKPSFGTLSTNLVLRSAVPIYVYSYGVPRNEIQQSMLATPQVVIEAISKPFR